MTSNSRLWRTQNAAPVASVANLKSNSRPLACLNPRALRLSHVAHMAHVKVTQPWRLIAASLATTNVAFHIHRFVKETETFQQSYQPAGNNFSSAPYRDAQATTSKVSLWSMQGRPPPHTRRRKIMFYALRTILRVSAT